MQPVVPRALAPTAVFSSGFLQLPKVFGQNGWWVFHFSSNDPACSLTGTTQGSLSDAEFCVWASVQSLAKKGKRLPPVALQMGSPKHEMLAQDKAAG